MVPTDYRLEHVTARLIERLEGARRSFVGEPDRADAEFQRITRELLDAACAEYASVAIEPPGPQEEFLRREISATFLPRYARAAVAMTDRESRGYGLGPLANPAGRVAITLLAVIAAILEFRYGGRLGYAGLVGVATLPFLPDVLTWAWSRSYQRELQAIIDDMSKIQTQDQAYERHLPREPLANEPRTSPPRQRESQ